MNERIPNKQLVVYALSLLGGESKRVHTEDIAVKCFVLFPTVFSWTRYRQYPDKDIVRVALTDARKEQHGELVEGRTGQAKGLSAKTNRDPALDGWRLTTAGIEWVRENSDRLETLTGAKVSKEHRQNLLKQLRKLKEHELFRRYSEEPQQFSATLGELADLLKCRVDASPPTWARRFEKHLGQAQSAEQAELIAFVERCQEAFVEQAD